MTLEKIKTRKASTRLNKITILTLVKRMNDREKSIDEVNETEEKE